MYHIFKIFISCYVSGYWLPFFHLRQYSSCWPASRPRTTGCSKERRFVRIGYPRPSAPTCCSPDGQAAPFCPSTFSRWRAKSSRRRLKGCPRHQRACLWQPRQKSLSITTQTKKSLSMTTKKIVDDNLEKKVSLWKPRQENFRLQTSQEKFFDNNQVKKVFWLQPRQKFVDDNQDKIFSFLF